MTKKYEVGIWTPWSEVLCYECHGDTFLCGIDEGKKINKDGLSSRELLERNLVTTCNKCGKEIQLDDEVAMENNIANELKNLGIDASLEQLGGMSSACIIPRINEDGQYYITYNLDNNNLFVIVGEDANEDILNDGYFEFEHKEELIEHIKNLKDLKRL